VIELSAHETCERKARPRENLADWLVSAEGQRAIGAYQLNEQKFIFSRPLAPRITNLPF